jgi:hypothetical protein
MASISNRIKKQIIARLLALCEPMRTNALALRVIERKRTPFLTEAVLPALHLVVGDESVIEEDTRGWTMEFPVFFKFITADARDVDVYALFPQEDQSDRSDPTDRSDRRRDF